MLAALPAALRGLDEDPQVRVIVVRGEGDEAFVSGADLSDKDPRFAPTALKENAWHAWRSLSKPTVAMIQGPCMGIGVAIALSCDIRVGSTSSRFAIPVARLGIAYPFWAVEQLVRTVGSAWAAELLIAGRQLDAADAATAGLLSRVTDGGNLSNEIQTVVASIVAGAPLSIRAAKRALEVAGYDLRDQDVVERMVSACAESWDAREGRSAFLDKRDPQFQGR